MRKKTIALLFGLGFGISLLACIFIVGGAAAISSAAASCDASTTYCNPSASSGSFSILLLLGILTSIAGGVLSTISWIAVLVKQAQRQQWAWFILTLLFSSICMLLWLILEPEVPPAPQYATLYQPAQPLYPTDGPYPPVYPTDGPYSSPSYPPYQAPAPYQDPYRPQ